MRTPLLVALLLVVACDQQRPDRPHVADGFIRTADGRALVLRGVNLAGRNRWPPYFDYHGPDDFLRVRRDWAMNSIRLITTWAAIEPERGRYDEAYLDALAERVAWAGQAGLYVIVDLHQDVFGEGFGGDGFPRWTCDEARYAAHTKVEPFFLNYLSPPVTACFDEFWASASLTDAYAAVWRRLAERLGAYPQVLGFDVMNEPWWGSYDPTIFERDVLSAFYDKVTRQVRAAAPHWLAFLEPTQAHNVGVVPALPRFDFGDVVFAPHSYDSAAESGAGFDLSHREALLEKMALLRATADRIDAALWLGEFGGVAARANIGPYMDAQYDAAGEAAAGMTYWEYTRDDGYGLLDPDGREKAELVDVVARPYPERVAGDPISYAFDEATRAFTLRWRPRGELPTEIALPRRHYAGEVEVSCGGCAVERTEAGVRLIGVPAVDAVEVAVTPRQ